MKQVSYSGKYSLSAIRVHQSHLQFSFVVGNAFCPRFLHVWVFNYRSAFALSPGDKIFIVLPELLT